MIRVRFPHIPILALTVHDSDDKVFDALCAGASGYLLKNTPPERLLEALREVAAGGAPMSPEVARRVVRLFREFRPPDQRRLPPDAAGERTAEAAGRGASPEDRGARVGHQRQHGLISSEEHLREAAGALEDGSGRQGAARTADLSGWAGVDLQSSCELESPAMVNSSWSLSADLLSARALVWFASWGRDCELTPEAHRFFFDRYSRLADFYRQHGRLDKATRCQTRAEEHHLDTIDDGPPYAAAMAMPRPRQFLQTNAISARRLNEPDDAA